VLLVLEAGLRLGGYGFPTGVTVPCVVDDTACRGDNVKFAWRFFPAAIAREFDPFLFPRTKPDGTFRVFVLGASAAQGTPDPAYSFGRILQVMLDHAWPEQTWEVVVAAMPAINSHVVVEITRDLARYDPDLFVVYLGNNEVVGPHGPGTVFAPLASNLGLIRTGIRLRATRVGQLLAHVGGQIGAGRGAPKVWRGLEMFLDHHVSADDSRLEHVYRHFRSNLEDICGIAARNGARVILCTLGSNLRDCPPFASTHRRGLDEAEEHRWTAAYEEAVTHEEAGDYSRAIAGYLAAAQIDDRYADLRFRLGRCYWVTGEHEQAYTCFLQARELDVLRFRPDQRINDTIRSVAAERSADRVHLVDAEAVFQSESPFGVPGRELFHEHVHLNFHGNYVLARAIFQAIWTDREVPSQALAEAEPVLQESECARRLAYNGWAHYNVLFKVLNYYLKEPPFTNQLYHDQQVAALEGRVRQLEKNLGPEQRRWISAQYQTLLQEKPSDIWLRWRYAEFLSVQMGDEVAAAAQCGHVVSVLPHSYKPHLMLALSLGRLGRFAEAIGHLETAVAIKPTSGQARHLLGLAHHRLGHAEEALANYRLALRLSPDDEARRRMAELLRAQGREDEAREVMGNASLRDTPRGTAAAPNTPAGR
jgi:tetratricopeptide (TPR) repeat protein